MPLRTRDLEWLAGFLEGEGCFDVSKRYGSVRITACQVQRWPLEKCEALVGGRINGPRQQRNPNAQPRYDWGLSGIKAAGLMMTLYTLLSPRRQWQCRKALNLWRSRQTATKYQKFCKRGHPFTTENVYNSERQRSCKLCHNVAQARYRAARKIRKNGAIS